MHQIVCKAIVSLSLTSHISLYLMKYGESLSVALTRKSVVNFYCVLFAVEDANWLTFDIARLREIQMSEFDAVTYNRFSSNVRRQVQSLRVVIDSLQVTHTVLSLSSL